MSYPYDSSWRRPPRSPPRNSYPRDLLTKRVMSVAALRRELLDRRQGRAPTPPSRNIPVPLWHGETFEQYKREFEQWLLERKETLASLRDNPSRERNFWFSFAHQRTEIATHEAGITRPTATSTYSYYGPPAERKRQAVNELSSLQSPQTMSQIESSSERSTKRHKPDNPSSLESTQSSTQNESSSEVIEGHDTLSKQHQSDEISSLQSTQTLGQNEASIEVVESNETSIAAGPETDKSSPVQSPSQMLVQEESSSRANGSSEASISTVPPIQRLRYPHYLPVPLEEYLAQHVVTPKEYLREVMQLKEKSTPGVLDDKLPKIPVPLTPGKTLESYENSFRGWLSNRKESLETDPIRERGFRCQFALEKAFLAVDLRTTSLEPSSVSIISLPMHGTNVDADQQHISDKLSRPHSQAGNIEDVSQGNENIDEQNHSHLTNKFVNGSTCSTHSAARLNHDYQGGDSSSPSVSGKKQQNGELSGLPDTLPNWAKKLIARVDELERKVAQYESTSSWGNSGDTSSIKSQTSDGAKDTSSSIVPPHKTSRLNDTASSNHNGIQKEDTDVQDGRSETNNLTTSVSKSAQQSSIAAVKRDNRIRKTQEEAVAEILETSADIHREGIICLAEAILSRVQDNQNKKKKKLTKAYNLLYDEIMMNETAINDAAAYMKTLKGVDEAMAMEQQNEIMELVVSINKEKEKRSAALAQLIIHHWSSRMTILRSQLEGDPSKRRQGGASHEKLAAILSRLEKNRSKLDELETDISFHLQYVRAISPDKAKRRALRFGALRNVTWKLKKELSVKQKLETDEENAFTCFVETDEEVRHLVTDLLDVKRVRGVRAQMKFGVDVKRFVTGAELCRPK